MSGYTMQISTLLIALHLTELLVSTRLTLDCCTLNADHWLDHLLLDMAPGASVSLQFLKGDLDVDFAYTLCLEVAILLTAKQLPPERRQPIV